MSFVSFPDCLSGGVYNLGEIYQNMHELKLHFSREELHEATRLRHVLNQNIDVLDGDFWPQDGFGIPYENTFSSLLGSDSFNDVLSRRSSRHVLDLFGGGYFLGDAPFDTMTGVRLKNIDADYMRYCSLNNKTRQGWWSDQSSLSINTLKALMNNPKRTIIEGDAYGKALWNKVSDHMTQSGIPYIDLLVCRPHGPFNWETMIDSSIPVAARRIIFQQLITHACRLLSPHGGLLFSQIPTPQLYLELPTEYYISDFDGETSLQITALPNKDILKIERNLLE